MSAHIAAISRRRCPGDSDALSRSFAASRRLTGITAVAFMSRDDARAASPSFHTELRRQLQDLAGDPHPLAAIGHQAAQVLGDEATQLSLLRGQVFRLRQGPDARASGLYKIPL